ncbi:MAG: phage tail family protein [Clostridia bacterium]|nr:phage tail family protein [Clostridia bacterium]
MFRIEYISEGGRVILGGGTNQLFNVTSLSGFEMPPRTSDTIVFAGENGTTQTGKRDLARTLTIAGDVYGDAKIIEQAIKCFYYDGELFCIFNNVRRKIKCRCSTLDDFEKLGKSGISKFAVQFIADYPYFNDFYDTELPLYRQRNLVTDTFTLPCVFTERISEGDVNNTGDKIIYPTIYITDNSDVSAASGGVLIENETTGAKIELPYYTMVYGETITIDLGRRRLTSSVNGNITNELGDSTPDLSRFFLEVGINHLSFTNSTGQVLSAVIKYNPEYYTAVR